MENSIQKSSKVVNVILWIAQLLLAAMFLMAGFMKVATPIDQLAVSMPWGAPVPAGLIKFIGVSEIFGGVGFVIPFPLRIFPQLTGFAAIGLAFLLILVFAFYLSKG